MNAKERFYSGLAKETIGKSPRTQITGLRFENDVPQL